MGTFFLITVSPYIRDSKRVFGQYFYNVSSTFYVWYDSWDEIQAGTRAHGDRVGWPDMPPEEIPSMAKYLREHTPQQILARFIVGGMLVLANLALSYGYLKYVLVYVALLLAAIGRHRAQTRSLLQANGTLFTFLLGYFVVYALLYAWVGFVSPENRYVLAHFMPLMFVLSRGLCALLGSGQVRIGRNTISELTVANLAVLAVVAVDVYLALAQRVGTVYGGE